jgi:hypothetical protein
VKRFIVILSFVCLVLSSVLYTMDLVVALENKTSQKYVKDYFRKTLPVLKLSKIGKSYSELPLDCRGKVLCTMSDELSTLHRITLWLPKEIQKHIFGYMFQRDIILAHAEDSEEKRKKIRHEIEQEEEKFNEALEKFCNKSIIKSFKIYQEMREKVKKHDSIVPLFVMPKERRAFILNTLKPWYAAYMPLLLGSDEQQEIDELNKDERQYFIGTEVAPFDKETYKVISNLFWVSIMCGIGVGAGICLPPVCIESLFCCSNKYTCLAVELGSGGGCLGCLGCCGYQGRALARDKYVVSDKKFGEKEEI